MSRARAVPCRLRQTNPYGSARFANIDANYSRNTHVDACRVAHTGAVEHVHGHTGSRADTLDRAYQPCTHPGVDAYPTVNAYGVAQAKADL